MIYISLSSELSSCYNTGELAKNEVLEEFPDAKIAVIDTRTGSLGEGLMVII